MREEYASEIGGAKAGDNIQGKGMILKGESSAEQVSMPKTGYSKLD